jgi:hypothetical protein
VRLHSQPRAKKAWNNSIRRPDLAYTKAGHTAFLDVVVAEPTALFASTGELQGTGASIIAELRKNDEYRNMPRFGIYWTNGTAAPVFLKIVCADRPAALKMFISDLSICLSAHLGRIIGTQATRRRTTPPNYE